MCWAASAFTLLAVTVSPTIAARHNKKDVTSAYAAESDVTTKEASTSVSEVQDPSGRVGFGIPLLPSLPKQKPQTSLPERPPKVSPPKPMKLPGVPPMPRPFWKQKVPLPWPIPELFLKSTQVEEKTKSEDTSILKLIQREKLKRDLDALNRNFFKLLINEANQTEGSVNGDKLQLHLLSSPILDFQTMVDSHWVVVRKLGLEYDALDKAVTKEEGHLREVGEQLQINQAKRSAAYKAAEAASEAKLPKQGDLVVQHQREWNALHAEITELEDALDQFLPFFEDLVRKKQRAEGVFLRAMSQATVDAFASEEIAKHLFPPGPKDYPPDTKAYVNAAKGAVHLMQDLLEEHVKNRECYYLKTKELNAARVALLDLERDAVIEEATANEHYYYNPELGYDVPRKIKEKMRGKVVAAQEAVDQLESEMKVRLEIAQESAKRLRAALAVTEAELVRANILVSGQLFTSDFTNDLK